jgi:hypothetical protein
VNPGLRKIYHTLSSLRLTVFLLGFSVVLVFFGTLDQVHYGIYEAQKKYFQSFLALWQYPEQWMGGSVLKFLVIPMPGGYLLGGLLVANLLCAHLRFFRPKWRTLGIAVIHGGILLLLIGQFVTDLMQEDFQMWIDEGSSAHFAESFLHNELVIVETTAPDRDRVWAIDEDHLRNGKSWQFEGLPFGLTVQRFYQNASIVRLPEDQTMGWVRTTSGAASNMRLGVSERPPVYSQNQRNVTTALIAIVQEGRTLHTFLVSNVFEDQLPPQTFSFGDREFKVSLRFTRQYFPFAVHLRKFSHDRYPGTDIPRNFSSDVVVRDLETAEEREILIFMNNPMRYGGFTFYQASFAKEDTASMLQVVRNPGWFIPYLSCTLVSLGLLYQFVGSLWRFVGRMRA